MLAVSAWVAHAEGTQEQAEKLMRAAADGEDGSVKHVAMENRLYPMRELLAELLLEMGQAGPALREFEASLKETPNRYRGIYGAARAAEAAGDRRKAAAYLREAAGAVPERGYPAAGDRAREGLPGAAVRRLLTRGASKWPVHRPNSIRPTWRLSETMDW